MSGDGDFQNGMETYADKKCRLCGHADIYNINIFNAGIYKNLLTKILSVYPIIIYENDPLPKSICKKCINHVENMYRDTQRVMKNQMKWISNVRLVQPENRYIKLLDMIENSNNSTKNFIKTTLDLEVGEETVNRILLYNESQLVMMSSGHNQKEEQAETTASASNMQPLSKSTPALINIKDLLESNGCTLIKMQNKASHEAEHTEESKLDKSALAQLSPKMSEVAEKVIVSDEDEDIALAKLAEVRSKNRQNDLASPSPALPVKCGYCSMKFDSGKLLAVHQLIHLRLSTVRLGEKHFLEKSERRGRLITAQGRKCIRCLNCWRVFLDKKSILYHWTTCECDFYCHVCGKEFAQEPKKLREHVRAVHGISFRSSKPNRMHTDIKSVQKSQSGHNLILKINLEKQVKANTSSLFAHSQSLKHEQESQKKSVKATTFTPPVYSCAKVGRVSCNICNKVFNNFKACNSHMRKHKYAKDNIVLVPSSSFDATALNIKPERKVSNDSCLLFPTTSLNAKQNSRVSDEAVNAVKSPSISRSATVTSLTASSSVLMPSPSVSITYSNNMMSTINPPRGVRTKFVQRRTDLQPGMGLKVKSIKDLQNPALTTPTPAQPAPLHRPIVPLATGNPIAGNLSRISNSSNSWLPPPLTVAANNGLVNDRLVTNHLSSNWITQPLPPPAPSINSTLPTSVVLPNHISIRPWLPPPHLPHQIPAAPSNNSSVFFPRPFAEVAVKVENVERDGILYGMPPAHVQTTPLPNTCYQCHRHFSSNQELLQHKQLCRINRSVKCKLCDETFVRSQDYHFHMQQVHNL